LTKAISEPIRGRIVRRDVQKIGNQDHAICEHLQQVIRRAGSHPILSNQETRVGWFRDAYTLAMK